MCMEPFSAMTLFGFGTAKCYKATVNESETITDAKPTSFGSRFPGWPRCGVAKVERS